MTPSARRRASSREPYLIEVQLRRERVRSFDEYPYSLPVVGSLHSLALHPAVTFLVGENGSGKSTLLEAIAIACGFNAEGGSRNFNFARKGAQLIIATHSPILMAYPNACILEMGTGGIREISYEETEHFTVTRDFLNRYPQMLRVLLEEEEIDGSPP